MPTSHDAERFISPPKIQLMKDLKPTVSTQKVKVKAPIQNEAKHNKNKIETIPRKKWDTSAIFGIL